MTAHEGRVLMVSMFLHPALQDAIRYAQTALDLADSHAVFDNQTDCLSLEIRIVLAMTPHEHTSRSH